ncbi:glycine zipper 2TM domain-containing protein [Halomonas campisalis]|uniref:Glycine zipper 2TM domain-containing protein n=1 Tax=Billgrantia campisalis TaxID=74661 RepID=A0ABS9P5X8_9GAMM|nr:glycine zipper 2TM domain-containing protein [Halomonas campisalis]MCG6656505.1 glycine zipper 2TM domain-containing protein [Halomonas campisalis]MDR5861691.1 glycine zipper 2TM domain-containing protein [Halomonas campisalis]
MSKSIVVGTTLAVFGLGGLALGAWQVQQPDESAAQFAEILGVEAATRSVERPREVCQDVVVNREVPVEVPVAQSGQAAGSHDPHRIVGTAAGAIVGGLLGNQVGGGSGKKLATVAGAVGGGLAGREVQNRVEAHQHAQAGQAQPRTQTQMQTQSVTERQCNTVMESHEEHLGYDVTYRVDGEVKSRRMDSAPQAERLPVVEGEVQWQAALDDAQSEG